MLLGTNFPSKDNQAAFLQHLDTTLRMPWAISINAAERVDVVTESARHIGRKAIQDGQVVILHQGDTYLLFGARR